MKKMLLIAVAVVLAMPLFAQNKAKMSHADFKVWGNCSMCKTTIEKAAKIDGVLKVNWNQQTKILHMDYAAGKVDVASVQKAIAAAGYDNDGFYGDDEAYTNLHGCCQYDRKEKE
jgi:periplasmic mercuric ion binding protein